MKIWTALGIAWSVWSLCREVRRRMPLYVRGELSVENAERFSWHINACSLCRKAEAEERNLQAVLATVLGKLPKRGD